MRRLFNGLRARECLEVIEPPLYRHGPGLVASCLEPGGYIFGQGVKGLLHHVEVRGVLLKGDFPANGLGIVERDDRAVVDAPCVLMQAPADSRAEVPLKVSNRRSGQLSDSLYSEGLQTLF